MYVTLAAAGGQQRIFIYYPSQRRRSYTAKIKSKHLLQTVSRVVSASGSGELSDLPATLPARPGPAPLNACRARAPRLDTIIRKLRLRQLA